jgi:hypothetical protein
VKPVFVEGGLDSWEKAKRKVIEILPGSEVRVLKPPKDNTMV